MYIAGAFSFVLAKTKTTTLRRLYHTMHQQQRRGPTQGIQCNTPGNMTPHRLAKVKPAKATLCQVSGHSWKESTVTPTVRVCVRDSCKLIQQKIEGHWRNKSTIKDNRKTFMVKVDELARTWLELDFLEMPSLWDEGIK